jgi:hypothetical protein
VLLDDEDGEEFEALEQALRDRLVTQDSLQNNLSSAPRRAGPPRRASGVESGRAAAGIGRRKSKRTRTPRKSW